ncbi:5-formyltetrahydrofolate cyclo-ligase [Marilutibacter chinensis]|uniref:5-formyltetrahydrofolate cyclo-ligase n=1 Tax=Marilutibacter chinensis TaxID=2912247 RepID=A0ABS9HZ46_9GAMM|nr:5-formyltetrahydrofolate cyclo-ligase [Lysobacter chinensis]MCF7223826.1 5-formyltetrahydrofolate cyclo-ligase [Lysobacter chinensis]
MTSPEPVQRRQLREDLRRRRRVLPDADRRAAEGRLAERLLALPFAPRSGAVAGYWACDGEIGLDTWLRGLPEACRFHLPVLGADFRLHFAPWRPGDALVENRYGIPEPDVPASALLDAPEMALMVLPLVGFGPHGQRLGMGGGWYDRNLAFRHERPAPPWLVGAAFELQRVDGLQAAPWDVPLDAVCTEAAIHDFHGHANPMSTDPTPAA